MSANKELFLALLDGVLKSYNPPGSAAGQEGAFAPPPFQSAPAAGGQAGNASPDPRVVIPQAPRQPFNWRNEERISYPVRFGLIGDENGAAAAGRGVYGRFGQRYAGRQAQYQPGRHPAAAYPRMWGSGFWPYGSQAPKTGGQAPQQP